jgi:hypothetical protein
MWLDSKKWRSDSIESRIYSAAVEQARADGREGEAADAAGLDAVFSVMHLLFSSPYDRVVEIIADRYDLETSVSALSRFYERFAGPWMTERLRRASATARELSGELDREAVHEASLDQISQAVFELMLEPGANVKQVSQLYRLILASRKQDLDARKISILETKAAAADAAKSVLHSTLTPDEQAARLREILA